jgi:hypothetical protein
VLLAEHPPAATAVMTVAESREGAVADVAVGGLLERQRIWFRADGERRWIKEQLMRRAVDEEIAGAHGKKLGTAAARIELGHKT